MSLKGYSIDDKLKVIEDAIVVERAKARANGTSARGADRYEVLKAIAGDLRGRQSLPRSNALGNLDRAMNRLRASKTATGYSDGAMLEIANVVISKWPTISQALESFGEESPE